MNGFAELDTDYQCIESFDAAEAGGSAAPRSVEVSHVAVLSGNGVKPRSLKGVMAGKRASSSNQSRGGEMSRGGMGLSAMGMGMSSMGMGGGRPRTKLTTHVVVGGRDGYLTVIVESGKLGQTGTIMVQRCYAGNCAKRVKKPFDTRVLGGYSTGGAPHQDAVKDEAKRLEEEEESEAGVTALGADVGGRWIISGDGAGGIRVWHAGEKNEHAPTIVTPLQVPHDL